MRPVLALVALAGCAPDYTVLEHVEAFAFQEAPERVVVRIENGSVELIGRADDLVDTRVEVTARWSRRPPTWTTTLEDGRLEVVGRCTDQRTCSTDVRVRVPPHVEATVETHAGDLVLGQLIGTLDASTRAGDVFLDGFRGGRLDLYSEAGTLTTDDVEAVVVIARTEAGAIDLRLDGALERVVAETDAGAVSLDVPAGGYRLDLEAEAGAISLDGVHHESGAPGVLRVQTDAGGVAVTGH